jgi:hypothetical protein
MVDVLVNGVLVDGVPVDEVIDVGVKDRVVDLGDVLG